MNRVFFLILMLFLCSFSFASLELPYNYKDTNYVNIKMTPLIELASNGEIYEGQEVKFKVRNNVFCHGTLLVKKGTIVIGRVETILTKGMNGFPAEIILNNFKFDGIEKSQLIGEYVKTGRNYALLVYPIKWALTPIPFVGSLTNLIMGGEAKIKTDDIITIKFFPHWK